MLSNPVMVVLGVLLLVGILARGLCLYAVDSVLPRARLKREAMPASPYSHARQDTH
jgi:hypothetical protein